MKVVMAIGLVAVILGISAVVGLGLSMNADSGMTHLQHSAVSLASVAASNEPVTQPVSEIACVPEIAKETVVPAQSARVSESVVSVVSNLEPATLTTNPPTQATTTNDDEVVVKFKDNAGWSGMSYIDPSVASNSTTNNDIDHFLSENNLTVAGYYRPQNTFVLKAKGGNSATAKVAAIANSPIVASVQPANNLARGETTQYIVSVDSMTKKATEHTDNNHLRMAAAPTNNLTLTINYTNWSWFWLKGTAYYNLTVPGPIIISADGKSWTASGSGQVSYPNSGVQMSAVFSANGPMPGNYPGGFDWAYATMNANGVIVWNNQQSTMFFNFKNLALRMDAAGSVSDSGTVDLTDSTGKVVDSAKYTVSGNVAITPTTSP